MTSSDDEASRRASPSFSGDEPSTTRPVRSEPRGAAAALRTDAGFRRGATRVAALLLCAVAGGALFAGCGCDDDEYSPPETCDVLTESVNDALESCGLPSVERYDVCGTVCESFIVCQEQVDVDACASAISSLGCDEVDSGGYKNLSECADIFTNIATSCDDDDDWDDDDWD